ncbi:WD domain, G-beta repeat protein (macronuclear) [Tetrahymena thermophila SB210]|uniref:WD domain, G-beta repeat protein n=1 Tax=Tetrahymena thermophila (strain SB210) TaxID=312017 RepID=Q22N63_TETTS|nr:WD domain, G-beta repeat protein [Tetrahymena thermophila SB210]EAR86922.2 WD domain, G-beta repeat protein [Tetrahymena thermophila SB210]|eukprot:XP_001007167.2 WD domain, G-beta repeat protein [Tetrahymena thermophila SB210]
MAEKEKEQSAFEDEAEKQKFRQYLEKRNESQVRKVFQNGKMMNGCTLEFDTAFGINCRQIQGQLSIIGDGQIVFNAANMIVIKDLTSKQYQFIQKENRFKNITCMTAQQLKNKSIIIAVGESSMNDDKPAMIVVTYQNKWHVLNQGQKGVVKQVSINTEKSYCCGLILPQGSNQPILNFWSYKKDKLLATMPVKANLAKFSLHPSKSSNIVLTGQNYFRMWEVFFQEKQLKESHNPLVPLKIEKENRFLDHVWITNTSVPTLVVLAAGNLILILQNDQLKRTVEIDVANLNIVDAPVNQVNLGENDIEDVYGLHNVLDDIIRDKGNKEGTNEKAIKQVQNNTQLEFISITSTRRGFILGGNRGCVCIYDIEKNYQIVNIMSFEMKFQNNDDHKIFFLSSSSNDSIISIASYEPAGSITYHLLNTYQLDTEVSPIQPFFTAGFHTKKINGITTSITKNIFATCSEDNTVKIWNYYESESQEKRGIISQYFKEEPLSVSLHPFGMFIAVGFTNGFKIFAILNDQLYPLKEVNLTNCKLVKYSHGGHYLLTNEKNTILIYDTIYYEAQQILEGHPALIRDVCITSNDIYIVSTCMNGYVFCWNILESTQNIQKTFEHQENSIYNCIYYDLDVLKKEGEQSDESNLFVGCSNEKYLSIYKERWKKIVAEFPVTDCYVTSLVVSTQLKCIFLGTNKGRVRVSVWPLDDDAMEYEQYNPNTVQVMQKIPDFFEIAVHSSAITQMVLSYDNQYLFTGDEDGQVFMLKIADVFENGELIDFKKNSATNSKNEDKLRIEQTSNDLFLAKISKIMEKNELKKKLQFEVVKLEQTKKIETQKLDNMYKQKMDAINKDFQITMESDMKMKDTFVSKSNDEYNKLYEQFVTEQKKYKQDIEQLEQLHKQKIEYENQRNKDLEDEIEKIKQKHKDDLQNLLNQHKEDLKKLKMNFYEKCQKIQVKYSNVVDNTKNFGNAFITRLENQDVEYEKEIDEKIKELKEEISKIKRVNEDLEKKNQDLIKQYEKLKREDEDLQKKIDEQLKRHNEIRMENLKNDQDILKMQHQLLERLQVIDSKEETCKQAKDEQINLENFRYMLNQKKKSLQNEKGNLLDKITNKEKNLKNMFNELIKESNQNEQKYQDLKKLNAEIKVLENSIKKCEVEIFFNTNKLTSFQNQLQTIMKSQESVTVVGKKLYDMLEKSKNNEEFNKYSSKKVISNEDIKEIIKMKQEKPNEVNDELLRQGRWMTKKLHLIKITSDKLKQIRGDNINTILNQNTKLIEECNLLRGENERYRKEMKKIEKLLAEAIRKRQKLRNQSSQNPAQMKKLIEKYDENEEKLQSQKERISNIKQSIEEIVSKVDESSSRLPAINNKKGAGMSITVNQSGLSTDISQSRIGKQGIQASSTKDKSVLSQQNNQSIIGTNNPQGQVQYPETVVENPLEHDRPTTSEMGRKKKLNNIITNNN